MSPTLSTYRHTNYSRDIIDQLLEEQAALNSETEAAIERMENSTADIDYKISKYRDLIKTQNTETKKMVATIILITTLIVISAIFLTKSPNKMLEIFLEKTSTNTTKI